MKTRNILNLVFTLFAVVFITGIAQAQLTSNNGYVHLRSQFLYGNNASAIYYNSNHATYSQLIMRDKDNTVHGKLMGSGNGAYFGLMDGDGNWSYMAKKDDFTAFKINNQDKLMINSNGRLDVHSSADATGSANTGAIDINNKLRIDENEIITNTDAKLYLQHDNNGDLSVDGTTFIVDASMNRVGIKNTAPRGDLHISDRLVINSPGAGYWGWIGNNVYWDSNASAANNPKRVVSGHAAEYGFTNTGDLLLRTATNGAANTKVNYKLNMIIKNNGGIGINTWDVPEGYELAVNGKVIAEEVKVKPSNFWDDVFMEGYDLMTMEEKQAFTQREHHLPSFEPEAVIVSEGMDVGESFADVAKELEEAHLYIFQLNDMIKELRKEIDDLKEQVNK